MGIRGGGGDRPAHGGEDAGPRVEEAGSCFFFSVDGRCRLALNAAGEQLAATAAAAAAMGLFPQALAPPP
uniref:Uncharacterized protein n=1 Tax=Oryza rufipogon TaxID=4529 RepID=A0A0E0PGP2_ORYRU